MLPPPRAAGPASSGRKVAARTIESNSWMANAFPDGVLHICEPDGKVHTYTCKPRGGQKLNYTWEPTTYLSLVHGAD